MTSLPDKSTEKVEAFVARWQGQEGGQERANYSLFLTELCDVLELPHPDPAGATRELNDYAFERVVTHHRDDGDAIGRIDLYRRNSFVLEAKQSRWKGGGKAITGQSDLFTPKDPESVTSERGKAGARRARDVLMINAKRQAEEYARALPPSHGWPPFILVCDVGHCIEIYADFTRQGKNYTQFGVGNDPRYSKSKIFDPFPFPSPGNLLKAQIRSVAEELDAFRKQRQKEYPSLTLTQMYNVLEKLRRRDAGGQVKSRHDDQELEFSAEEERVRDEGLILILKELHDKLDHLVFQAYEWPYTLSGEEILTKLVTLNHLPAAEERRGHVRWLRPDYQIPPQAVIPGRSRGADCGYVRRACGCPRSYKRSRFGRQIPQDEKS